MTREKYFNLMDQMKKEPNPDDIPPELIDFPQDVQKAILVFNNLGDRILPDIGYLGKDYSQLPIFIDIYEVQDKKLFLDTLLKLDTRTREKSAAEMKAQRAKLKASKL